MIINTNNNNQASNNSRVWIFIDNHLFNYLPEYLRLSINQILTVLMFFVTIIFSKNMYEDTSSPTLMTY